MKISFKKGKWENKLIYAYTRRYDAAPVFVQEEDCVRNRKDANNEYGYENISVFLLHKYGAGTEFKTSCSFEKMGAPLIVLAEELEDNGGVLKFGNYIEIVLWEQGINVWRMHYDGKDVTWKKLLSDVFSVSAGKKYTLGVKLEKDELVITCGRHKLSLAVENMPEEYYFGVDACEDINRFYNISVNTY